MIKAKLFVFGTERELLDTDLEYYRVLNSKTGRCGQIPMGGLVTLSFGSTYNDDVLLRRITNAPEGELCTLTACKIVFYEDDLNGIALFEYKYNDAALVCWKETFNSVGTHPMMITITISAAIQEVKGITWVKTWQESWIPPSEKMPYQSQEPTVIEEDLEPKFLKFFFEDEKGTVIPQSSLEADQNVVLVVLTENADKDTVNLNLKDNRLDYKFDGKTAVDDLIKGIVITGDETRIQLETIEQQQ